MLYLDLVSDIWAQYAVLSDEIRLDKVYALTAEELAQKFTGMHRVITIMRDNDVLSYDEASILRQLCRDCRRAVRKMCEEEE